MYAAADDIDSAGTVAALFDGVPVPPGSVPQLRLLAALHHLVLSGRAPQLAEFYPSAGGSSPPGEAWPVAERTISENFDWLKARLPATVQTNEPGRAVVLFAALLWLTARYRRPIRLLEIGASAGLNLIPDRYCYVVDGNALGEPSSPVRFHEPWTAGPDVDLAVVASALRIVSRAGCDIAPLDPRSPEDRLTLLSYIWPDELERIDRARAALLFAAQNGVAVEAKGAAEWLPGAAAATGEGELTVLWQSVFRQYLTAEQWEAIEHEFGQVEASDERPLVWLRMEPGRDHLAHVRLTCRTDADAEAFRLAGCGDHGPPVVWDPDPRFA